MICSQSLDSLLIPSLVQLVVEAGSYDDSANCDAFPDYANYSKEMLQAEAMKYIF